MNKRIGAIIICFGLMFMVSIPEKLIANDFEPSKDVQTVNYDTGDITFPAVISTAFPNNAIARAIAYGVYGNETQTERLVTIEQLEAIKNIRFYMVDDAVDLNQLLTYNKFPNLKRISTTFNNDTVIMESLSVLTNENFPVLEDIKVSYIATSETAIMPDIQLANLKQFLLLAADQEKQIKEIPDFSGISNIEYLRIYTAITEIPNFSNLPNITSLNINVSMVNTVFFPGFDNMPNLEHLTIDGTEELNLSNNIELPEMNLPNLYSIGISNLGLTSITSLDNLPKLQEAHFYLNKIEKVETIVSESVTNLMLSHNKLTEVPAITPNNSVTYLEVGYNEIVDFTNIENYQKVEAIDAIGNKVRDISMLEENFPNLGYISFYYNSLEARPERFSDIGSFAYQTITGEDTVIVGENYLLNLPIFAQLAHDEQQQSPTTPFIIEVKLNGELVEVEVGEMMEIPTNLLEPGVYQLTVAGGPEHAGILAENYAEAEYTLTVVEDVEETTENNSSDKNDTDITLPATGIYTKEVSFVGGFLLIVGLIVLLFKRIKEKR